MLHLCELGGDKRRAECTRTFQHIIQPGLNMIVGGQPTIYSVKYPHFCFRICIEARHKSIGLSILDFEVNFRKGWYTVRITCMAIPTLLIAYDTASAENGRAGAMSAKATNWNVEPEDERLFLIQYLGNRVNT